MVILPQKTMCFLRGEWCNVPVVILLSLIFNDWDRHSYETTTTMPRKAMCLLDFYYPNPFDLFLMVGTREWYGPSAEKKTYPALICCCYGLVRWEGRGRMILAEQGQPCLLVPTNQSWVDFFSADAPLKEHSILDHLAILNLQIITATVM